jgi:hypothetical protein
MGGDTTEQAQAMPAPVAEADRRYPLVEASINLALPLGFQDARPNLGTAPDRHSGELLLARLPEVHGPLSPELRATLDAASAPTPPSLVASLRSPIARPETIAALPSLDTAPAAAPAPLLVDVSPRPPSRPGSVVAFAATRSPTVAEVDNIVLARAEAPTELERPAPLSENPDRTRLFPPRAGDNPCSARLARAIPRRPGNAAPASAIMASLGNGSGSGRDNAIIAEAMRGNVPDHIRALQPVRFTGSVGGRQTEITICVTPDYLAVGSNSDHVRVPLGLPAALRVADAFDMMLPTTRMVDAIYAQADLRLSPRR